MQETSSLSELRELSPIARIDLLNRFDAAFLNSYSSEKTNSVQAKMLIEAYALVYRALVGYAEGQSQLLHDYSVFGPILWRVLHHADNFNVPSSTETSLTVSDWSRLHYLLAELCGAAQEPAHQT